MQCNVNFKETRINSNKDATSKVFSGEWLPRSYCPATILCSLSYQDFALQSSSFECFSGQFKDHMDSIWAYYLDVCESEEEQTNMHQNRPN